MCAQYERLYERKQISCLMITYTFICQKHDDEEERREIKINKFIEGKKGLERRRKIDG